MRHGIKLIQLDDNARMSSHNFRNLKLGSSVLKGSVSLFREENARTRVSIHQLECFAPFQG